VRGKLADDGVTINASAIAVMKQQDIAQLKQQELLDWQKRSLGGLVKQVDTSAGTVTLTVGTKAVVVSTTRNHLQTLRPDSVSGKTQPPPNLMTFIPAISFVPKATRMTMAPSSPRGDRRRNLPQHRRSRHRRRSRTGHFDRAGSRDEEVRQREDHPDSQMKKLPLQLAQGLAMRMKGITPPAAAPSSAPAGASPDGARARGGDLNQMLARLPAAALGDIQKGEAVMIVSTEGSAAQPPVAITLLGGVEPMLTASPTGKGAESFLTPWSLASAPGGDQ